jgi:hypothetical protein
MLFFLLIMRFIKFLPLLFLSLFVACKSSPPPYVSFFVSDGVIQYFLSPTKWAAKGSTAKLDATYRTGVDLPAIVNISFYGNKSTPKNVSSVFLRGAEVECLLEYITVILVEPDKNELRISFYADRDKFVNILRSEKITLTAEVDGTEYVYIPKKKFFKNKNKFLVAISIN